MRDTTKKSLYLEEVLRLYNEEHMNANRIAKHLPLARQTIVEWINIFAADKSIYIGMEKEIRKRENELLSETVDLRDVNDIGELKKLVTLYAKEMKKYKVKSEVWEELVNVAESKGMQVRKKAGVKL